MLSAAADRATDRGMRLLRASGAEFEAGLNFGVLHQLLYPLRDRVDRVGGDQCRRILDLSPNLEPDPPTLTAVLALLTDAAAEQPLLMIVDDLGLIDPASASVLGFAARRFGSDPIALLSAARFGASGLRLPELLVGPLDAAAAETLLDSHWPALAPAVRRRMLDEAAGNPLALQELPTLLDGRQRSGRELLPEFLPLSDRLLRTFAPDLQTLPSATRELLVQLALEPAGIRGSAPALDAELVRVDADGRIRIQHPLTRLAIVHEAPPDVRRNAHQTLAAVMADSPVRQAWHQAGAIDGPDETVALALEDAAMPGRSPAALVRAAELSPRAADRSRRLAAAAWLATITGQLDDVPHLLADATPDAMTLVTTAQLLTYQDGDLEAAHRLLAQALDVLEDTDGLLDPMLSALLFVSLSSSRPEPWELLNKAMARFEPEDVVPFRLCYEAYVDPCRKADAIRAGLAQAFTNLPADAEPWRLIPLAFAATAMDLLSDYRYLIRRMIDRERVDGAIAMVVPGLMLLSQDSYVHGRWDEADRLAQEALDLATTFGYQFWVGQIQALRRRSEALTEIAPSTGIPGRWMVFDQVEAAIRSGELERARAYVAAAHQTGLHRISPRIDLMVTGAAALIAPHGTSETADAAGALFEAALSVPDADRWPFDRARVQFAHGQWLRRTHDTARARAQLRAALETFDRIGAEEYARRAREELRAAGVASGPRPAAAGVLTTQEQQIAELAATGLTNKEIAARLVLSHRTVASHLHRLYPKLGIAARAGLRAALDAIPQD
ncbi:regulatory LuxR family protein [Kribbella kalugense]|uniref:Regulatory LuxR family protein n=1 Tax=Kribbella kalugense TaxID=2512221 RepID=A0A4R7ZV09_9ACTN|nr:regulatory LuxR family protein [Kribbella kalugense]